MAKAKYSKGKDGRFTAFVWDGTYSKDGSKHRKKLTSNKSSKDLENKVIEFNENLKSGYYAPDSNTPFVEYAWRWFELYKGIRSINTKAMYKNIIEKHLAPEWKPFSISKITNQHLQALINARSDKPRTCQQICLTVKQIFKAALSEGIISIRQYKSIFAKVELPKYRPNKKRALLKEELIAIRNTDFDYESDKAYIYIIYYCGLRREETLALTKEHINFEHNTLTISQALVFDKNNPIIAPPKSHNSYRTIPMPRQLAIYLKFYIKTISTDFLFTSKNGLMTHSAFVKMWSRIKKVLNLDSHITSHIFRHNYCTNLCYQIPKISIKKIAYLLGDSEKMVLEVYNHIIEDKESVIDALESSFTI